MARGTLLAPMSRFARVLGVVILGLPTLLATSAVARGVEAQAVSSRGQSAAVDRLEAQLRVALSGYEDAPSRASIAQLGEDGVAALLRIHADTSLLGAIRLRAVTCLGWIPGASSRRALEDLLASSPPALELRAAIRALADHARTAHEEAAAAARIAPFARHADEAVREAVALELRALQTR